MSNAPPTPDHESLGSRIKAAGQLTAQQAQRAKLAMITLPAAYRALGNDLNKTGSHRDEFPELYGQLDRLNEQLKAIKTQAASRHTEGLAAKAKAAAASATDMAQSATLKLRSSRALGKLGEAAYEKQGKQCGPAELVHPITEARSRLTSFDAEIAQLSQSKTGQWLTPKRIAIGGWVLVVLLLLRGGGIVSPRKDKSAALQQHTASPNSSADSGDARTEAGRIAEERKPLKGLTADYLPFEPGTQRVELSDMYMPNGQIMRSRIVVSHKAGGIIETITVRIGSVANGKVTWLKDTHIASDFPNHFRQTHEFVQIGAHLAENDEIDWEPKLKIGAISGESWSWKPTETMTIRYQLIELNELVARIKTELIVDGTITTINMLTYEKHVGLIAGEAMSSFGSDDGQMHRTSVTRIER